MLLVVDVGNTQTVVGVYAEMDQSTVPAVEQIVAGKHAETLQRISDFQLPLASWRLATNKQDTADDIRAKVLPLMRMAHVSVNDIQAVALASVVPTLTQAWIEAVTNHGRIAMDVRVCTAEAAEATGLFATDYPNPREIGADRIADAVAARELFGAPCVVVDFGTATNIEVIGADGKFLGGIIAPGMETGAAALFSYATKLAAIGMEAPPHVIGLSSEQAMQSGIILGEAARVDGLVARIFDQLGCSGAVVATGGLASLVAEHSVEITDVLPELTLEGLRLIAKTR